MTKNVYLDNAATTKIREEVLVKMQETLQNCYGNPSSTHSFGRASKTRIEQARKTIAKELNASASEIIFTSGGTETDNMVLRAAVRDLGVETIITSKIEHHAVLHTVEQLKKEYNIAVNYVELDGDGTPKVDSLEQFLQANTTKKLVSLMHVNNEIGNMIAIDVAANLCKQHDALFHSDAVQSIGHFKWDVQQTPVDFLAAAAHKFHGPKGAGFAYIRKNSGLQPLIFGGEQERGFRAGTEALHNIVGLEEAFVLAYKNLEEEKTYILELKHYFIEKIKHVFPDAIFNGNCVNSAKSTYTLVNVCLPFSPEKAQILLFQLDINGIACSKGSACQSGSSMGSHVLQEILPKDHLQKPSLRFSFSIYNTKAEIDYTIKTLKDFAEN